MQTPDANGYVHVQWPSKSIPHGGIFHTRVAEPSEAQQQFLKVLLEEQKLTILQRDKSKWRLRQTESKDTRRADFQTKQQVHLVRPRTSRRRSQSVIRESGAFELDPYRPLKRGEDRELLKSKLALSMEYGDTTPEQPMPPPPPRAPLTKPKLPTDRERRQELLTQIRERAEWLAEMEDLGQAAPHREIVGDQIAERLRALEVLGVDSPGSSARSTVSGFSTTGPIECTDAPVISSAKSKGSVAKSIVSNRSSKSQEKQNSTRSSVKGITKKEESVAAYYQLPAMMYSPRGRV